MNLIEVAILGLLQGLSEFIPISSSGHLIIASKLFNTDLESEDLNALIVFLHLGTIFALALYYYKNPKFVSSRVFHDNTDALRKITLSVIPAFIFGFIFSFFVEERLELDTSFLISCIALILTGSFFIASSKVYTNKNKLEIKNISNRKAFIIGLFQAIGIVYGVSRSGITISGSRLAGLNNTSSTNYAFIVSIPLILGAAAYSLLGSYEYLFNVNNILNSLVGLFVSFVSGYLAIDFLFRYLKNNNLNLFGAYCIAVGVGALLINFLF